jgi:glutathione peroxidase
LAFPLADFRQELPDNDHIQTFLQENFPQVNFPVFGLSTLETNLVFQKLQSPGKTVRHNFFKYLVDRNGKVVHYYTKKQDPNTIAQDIETLLLAPAPRQHRLVTH